MGTEHRALNPEGCIAAERAGRGASTWQVKLVGARSQQIHPWLNKPVCSRRATPAMALVFGAREVAGRVEGSLSVRE
jgi:hypothetical protein